MKSLLLTVTPELLVNILNGKASILVRKKFPKDYVGWVYIYCSKGKTLEYCLDTSDNVSEYVAHSGKLWDDIDEPLNGKVVARFWCDKVEEIYFEREVIGEICDMPMFPRTNSLSTQELIEKSCTKYLPYGETEIGNYLDDKGYAIHISKLEIFDRPKELGEFNRYHEPSKHSACWKCKRFGTGCVSCSINKAPANYCYIDDFFFDNEEAKEPESVSIDEKETDGYCR